MAATSLDPKTFRRQWRHETTKICKIQTYRGSDDNAKVNGRLLKVRDYLFSLADEFNAEVTSTKFRTFQWCAYKVAGTDKLRYNRDPSDDDCLKADYWVMGLRFGGEKLNEEPVKKRKNRVALICHLDTVPAAEGDDWRPFHPHVEKRTYEYDGCDKKAQDFLVGRGCVDDKGPAISAFIAARTIAKQFDGKPEVEHTVFDIIFDTSEETDMSFPHYIEDDETEKPDFGVVYDAQWVVRAEKGCERPVFSVLKGSPPSSGLYIESLLTAPNNSTNTIPDWTTAVIKGDPDELERFANNVQSDYESFQFDDPDYVRAPFSATPNYDGVITSVTLETKCVGAQHGSAPDANRLKGANPLISLANYLAGKVKSGTIVNNDYGTIADFIYWMFGTTVFGENHRDELYKFDTVFTEGNGTTYAVTRVSENTTTGTINLEVDIRYAIPHHEEGWDEVTEGLIPGNASIFGGTTGLFQKLVDQYNSGSGAQHGTISCSTQTIFGPDIRTPDTNDHFKIVEQAYRDVRGVDPVRFAVGGGTDAKGYTFLLGVGPLMCGEMGPPINYHGMDEGAPMHDMCVSTEILVNVFTAEIKNPPKKPAVKTLKALMASIERVKELRKNGHKHCCSC